MSEIKLLPCPFCGGEVSLKRDQKDDFVEYSVGCYNRGCVCAAHTYCYYDKEEAIRDWNTRKPMERIVEIIKDYMEDAEHYGFSSVITDMVEAIKEVGGIE